MYDIIIWDPGLPFTCALWTQRECPLDLMQNHMNVVKHPRHTRSCAELAAPPLMSTSSTRFQPFHLEELHVRHLNHQSKWRQQNTQKDDGIHK
mgnify:FL=1